MRDYERSGKACNITAELAFTLPQCASVSLSSVQADRCMRVERSCTPHPHDARNRDARPLSLTAPNRMHLQLAPAKAPTHPPSEAVSASPRERAAHSTGDGLRRRHGPQADIPARQRLAHLRDTLAQELSALQQDYGAPEPDGGVCIRAAWRPPAPRTDPCAARPALLLLSA